MDEIDEINEAEVKATLFHYFQVASNFQLDVTHQDQIESIVDGIVGLAIRKAIQELAKKKTPPPTYKKGK